VKSNAFTAFSGLFEQKLSDLIRKYSSKIPSRQPSYLQQLMAAKTSYIKNHILAKYEGLKIDSHASPSKKIWQRFRFGSKTEELGVIRGKLITYTCTISILIDTLQIHAADRVEGKIDGGFAEIASQFEKIRKEIFQIASHARAEERRGATMSSLSLSTYAGDDKVVWQDFRRELLKKGFRSQSLEKYKNVLQAYMLKLDQSGLLDQPNISTSDQTSGTPWWVTRMYMETINSLADLELNDHPPSTIGDSPSGYNTRSPASFESNRAELTGGGTCRKSDMPQLHLLIVTYVPPFT